MYYLFANLLPTFTSYTLSQVDERKMTKPSSFGLDVMTSAARPDILLPHIQELTRTISFLASTFQAAAVDEYEHTHFRLTDKYVTHTHTHTAVVQCNIPSSIMIT